MTAKADPVQHIPKYQQLQRMATERYPSLDATALEAYLTLLGVAHEVEAASGANLARYGLAEGRHLVLGLLLKHHPAPLSHSQLAELSGVTKGNITGLVDGLERDGHVERKESGDDRRVTPIALTPAGHRLIEKILPDRYRRIAELMGNLSTSERKTLVSLLVKVQAGLPAFRRE
ncbi:MAG: MarR family transcriptional regulator [Tepidisphaeraceae bacterium]